MSGETNLRKLIKNMSPLLNDGKYVFITVKEDMSLKEVDIIGKFKEQEGTTIIIEKSKADKLNLKYDFVASWITLQVHSSLEAVGLTAAFANALANENISCNIVAGYYHDHIFVDEKDTENAMIALQELSKTY